MKLKLIERFQNLFPKSAHDESVAIFSRINRFMFKIYGYQKVDDSIILKDETTESF